jgi:disease resistance protein RPM1
MSCVGRYFIVIDDIWDINVLEGLTFACLENNHGSRILSTTRQLDVAREAGDVYMLEPLSYDNSKILFYTTIFGELGSTTDDVLDTILKRCGGDHWLSLQWPSACGLSGRDAAWRCVRC